MEARGALDVVTQLNIEEYRPQIEAALRYAHGTHEFEDVVQMLLDGRAQAWANGDSIAITEIIAYPRKKVLHCFLAGGKSAEIIAMMEAAAAWGKSYGCTAFTIAGRKGWQRVLGKHGWRPTMTVMELPI